MPTYTIRKDEITKLVETLQEKYDVYGPIPRRTSHVFDKIEDASKVDLGYDSTIMSPKKYLTPTNQVMMRVGLKDTTIEDSTEDPRASKPRVLFGVHACDINGILFLDKVFGGIYNDPYYAANRENTTLVGINCLEPCKYGFCRSVEKNFVLEGYDLFLTAISETHYYVHVGSPKGDDLIYSAGDVFSEASLEDNNLFKTALRKKHESHSDDLYLDYINETLDMAWDDPIWDELGELCMNCGSCALVCPTCYCFDVKDNLDLTLTNVERTRKWDTCLYYDFATVAGNHNFRSHPPSRLKYRFYHKFRAAVHEHGTIACTGCGRCTATCPAGISIKEVLHRLQDYWASSPSVTGG
ncbi:MAG: 4Fe-4S dicluster domain-containing protein [Candidatus Thorarchaeota archaeon]|nr:4Fe-4S dicluster domain-containing protein [Candidatus Thorarchaeota archaeon]